MRVVRNTRPIWQPGELRFIARPIDDTEIPAGWERYTPPVAIHGIDPVPLPEGVTWIVKT